MRRRPTPVVFGPPSHQLLGLHHAPDPAIATSCGVVLCNPLGYEAMCAHRTYRHLAERLAAAGVHALRFDYHGTGDSSGDLDEPSRVRAWLDDIGAAIDELRAVSGAHFIDLFGVRFGATMATVVAAERGDVRGLVLWGPCASGRSYIRELRAFRLMKQARGANGAEAPVDGSEEIAGYLFGPATVREMSGIDLLARRQRFADRALVLPRGDVAGGEARLADHLVACGTDAVFRNESGYAELMRDPQETVVPTVALDGIVAWTRAAPQTAAGEDQGGARSPTSVLAAASRVAGRQVREEAFHFGQGRRLFGILTEPASGAATAAPVIVFLSVGANHRVGPNRMYVTLARDLAALGYVTFRFDLAGIGDSAAVDDKRENLLYSKASVEDVKEALTFLSSIRETTRTVLLGVCSGAFVAFHTAKVDPRVGGQILINPQTFERKEGDTLELTVRKSRKSTRYYLEALLDRGVWAQALRGGKDVRSVATVLSERLVARAGSSASEVFARLRGRPAPRTEIEQVFTDLSDRGVESLLVFSSNDGGLDMIEEHLGPDGRRIRGRANIRLAIIEDADHTFTPEKSRGELLRVVRSFVASAFPA